MLYERVENKGKLVIIPNFVDTVFFKPVDVNYDILDNKLFPESNSLKLMYAGNIGYAQDWITFLELSKQLKDEDIDFFIIGEGVMKRDIEEQIHLSHIENVHLLPYQKRELMPQLIAYSDIQFIFMDSKTESHGFPSKVYSIMASAKPLLVCSGNNTPITNFLNNKGCAFIVEENNTYSKVEKLIAILKNIQIDKLQEMGKEGLSIVKSGYTKDIVTSQYVELVDSIL
jgi:glycosyltransferase involved in cell wall biosynthesis